MEFDTVVRNGIIANASECILGQDIGIKDGLIACIGIGLPVSASTSVIDAQGGYITPGGVDSHVHLEQWNTPTGDTWETGTRSAVCGGTTTVLCFASQNQTDQSVLPVVEDYLGLAKGRSACDYGIHLILTNPTKEVVEKELPLLVRYSGITSVKLYMTYHPMKLGDREILDIMVATRRLGITTMVHAENHDMIELIIETLEQRGQVEPYYQAVSRPKIAEAEATYRAISLSELMDTPILLVHVSSELAAKHIRDAQTRMLPIYGETCPQYLYLLSDRLRGENFEGAKCVCSPPLRERPEDTDAMWTSIANGTFTTFSSDHAATKFYAEGGKRLGLINGRPVFAKIPNGLPGLETRLPLLFKGVEEGRITIQDFVRVASSNPAKLYGVTRKGAVLPGYDADLCIWYPTGKLEPFVLKNSMLHHDIDYTPFEDMTFTNWPRYTLLRGKMGWNRDDGGFIGKFGGGNYIKRTVSALAGPRNVFVNEWRPPI
ncbi:dihydropyrimidinase [Capronia coronata CBS 617.96]|uniref:dihydropyrimidinase n=1 Tax=Capronia coronata CBS 617.96 TaxID=1182541 RepID=W9YM63_9EURO|nr:dihydropyrimidinase [Capronia coronata CBS 617.96]EXJ83329.1 dihydropyrimidinase [Capronia coronata CBS 617.96]